MEFTAEMIAGFLGGEIVGDASAKVSTMAKIEEGTKGALSFLSNPKYEHYIYTTGSTIVIVNRSFEPTAPVAATLVKVDDAYASFAKLLELYAANKPKKQGISSLSSIDPSSKIDDDAYVGEFAVIGRNVISGKNLKIYPQVYVGDNVRLGDNVTLFPGVTIYEECVLGNNVMVHSGTVIGADGFGFAPNDDGTYSKIPQLGNVIIEDDVEIGANTCIDRATMGSTRVYKGVKIDNLVMLGHNTSVGENTVIASQTGLAGSSHIGRHNIIAGQAGIAGHLRTGDNVTIASKTGITNNIPDGEVHMGYPSMPARKHHRSFAIFRNLPELSMKVSKLEKEINRLKELLNEDGGN